MTLDELRTRLTVTADDLPDILHCSRGVVYQGLRDGTIPSRRLGARWIIPAPAVPRAACGYSKNVMSLPGSPFSSE